MRLRPHASWCAALLVCASSAWADAAPTGALAPDPALPQAVAPAAVAPSEDVQQLAAHYVKVYGFDDVLHLMVQHYRDEAISSWVGRTRRTRAEMSQAWDRLVQPELDARFGAFIDGMTQVVARNFDAEELRTMIAFEESDIGTKLRAVRPKVQDEMFDLERRVLSGALSSAISQHTEELRKLGLNYSQ